MRLENIKGNLHIIVEPKDFIDMGDGIFEIIDHNALINEFIELNSDEDMIEYSSLPVLLDVIKEEISETCTAGILNFDRIENDD